MPTNPQLEKAHQQLETARQRLEAALIDGGNTKLTRQQLIQAEARVQQLEAAEIGARIPDAAIEEAIREEAQSLVSDAAAEIAERAFDALHFAEPVPIRLGHTAAAELVRVQRRNEAAEAALAAWADARQPIAERIQAVQSEREAILARRLAGDQRADDSADVALMDADRDGLRGMLARHDAARPAAPVDVGPTQGAWQQAREDADGAALQAAAKMLQERFIELAIELEKRSIGRERHYRANIDWRLRDASARGIW
jgi:hypothetical protein